MSEKPLSVLVIEDNQMFRSLALQVFDRADKMAATNAQEGFKKFKTFEPDITLLDIGLPDESGLDLLPRLIEHNPESYIVMLTMSRFSRDVDKAKNLGASAYIIKPFTHKKVEECIGAYHEYRRKIESMTPEERAANYVQHIRAETVDSILEAQEEETHEVEPTPEGPSKEELFEQALHSWRILFVDDYLTNRERAREQLSQLGCHVDIAEDAKDFLNKCKEHTYDLVFLDTDMPGMSGYDATKELRHHEKEQTDEDHSTIVIGLIESAAEVEQREWLASGMNHYLRKPARFSQLREMITKHVEKKLDNEHTEYVD
jgi:CheY-like chemotaxis protein